ncbi:hypothetical protein TNCV_2438761 [Trichonephila clavipes]|nr:hypothetical protein TNCV_2438761 [Trichonephila clavipes]
MNGNSGGSIDKTGFRRDTNAPFQTSSGSACCIMMAYLCMKAPLKMDVTFLHSVSSYGPFAWCDGMNNYWVHDSNTSSARRR